MIQSDQILKTVEMIQKENLDVRAVTMGISLLGEAYINFGVRGAWVFMFLFGLVSSFIIQRFFLNES